MATTIKLKNGSGAPLAGDLVAGEPALDLTNKRLYTEDSGGTVIEVGTNPGTDITFADNRKAIFGAGSDLQIYHDGSNSIINEGGTGDLEVQANRFVVQSASGVDDFLIVTPSAGVDLRHNVSGTVGTKLATTSTGIDVTGDVNSDSVTTGTFTSTGIDDNATSTAITIDSSENVGINNTSPSSYYATDLVVGAAGEGGITIASTATTVAGYLMFADGTSGDARFRGYISYGHNTDLLGLRSASDIQFLTGGSTERMRIDGSGRTLIGTTSADQDAKLTVVGSGAGGSSPATISTNTVATFRRTGGLSHSANVSILGGSTGFSVLNLGDRDDEDVGRVYYDHTNNAMLFDTNAAERMRIDSSGNVGIGTASLSRKLVVYDSTYPVIALQNSGSGTTLTDGFQMQYDGTAYLWNYENSAMLFGTNSAERMRIQTDGQVLIGTSSILSGGIDGLHLNTVGGDTGITFGYSGTTVGWLYYIVGAAMQLQTPTGTTIRMVSDSNGVQLTNGATSWSSLSDERKKDIIEPITNAAEKISTLRTVIGKYKEEDEGTRRAFLIAQDVQKVLPEAVGENDDGDLLLQYTETIPLLVAAIKEQQAQITELKAEVAALKGA